jgi:hypothetical protein
LTIELDAAARVAELSTVGGIDMGTFQRYTSTPVGQFLKAAVVLVVIVSVATILISPDSSDDVDGVLQHHTCVAQPVFLTLFQSISHLTIQLLHPDLAIHRLECLDLLDLVCVRLC